MSLHIQSYVPQGNTTAHPQFPAEFVYPTHATFTKLDDKTAEPRI